MGKHLANDPRYRVLTGNEGLASSKLPCEAVVDPSVPDWEWRLVHDGRPITHTRDITPTVASDIREAIRRHQERASSAETATTPAPLPPQPDQLRLPEFTPQVTANQAGQLSFVM